MGWLPNVESCRTDVPGRAAVSPPRKWSVQPFPHQNRLVVFGVSASDACCLNECCSCVGGHWWTSSTPHSLCIRQTDFSSEIYRYLAAVGMLHRWQSLIPLRRDNRHIRNSCPRTDRGIRPLSQQGNSCLSVRRTKSTRKLLRDAMTEVTPTDKK